MWYLDLECQAFQKCLDLVYRTSRKKEFERIRANNIQLFELSVLDTREDLMPPWKFSFSTCRTSRLHVKPQ